MEAALSAYMDQSSSTYGGKSAAMWLNEICVKYGSVPKFSDADLRESASSVPRFETTVEVSNYNGRAYTAKAEALNKKNAKQKAALNVMLAMGITPSYLVSMGGKQLTKSVSQPSAPDDKMGVPSMEIDALAKRMGAAEVSDDATHVSDLAALCEQRSLGAPEYKLVIDEGPPHKKIFGYDCEVRFGSEVRTTHGTHSAKKRAKQQSAGLMLNLIKAMKPEEVAKYRITAPDENNMLHCNNRSACHRLLAHSHHRFLHLVVRELVPEDIQSYVELSQVRNVLDRINEKNGNFFSYNIVDNPHECCDGTKQSFLTLTYDIKSKAKGSPSVFLGSGGTSQEARLQAYIHALVFLREVANN